MKQIKPKVILDHSMVRIIEADQQYQLFIKMTNGKYASNAPYPADQRGIIAALQLALDVLAGKIMLAGTVDLDDIDKPSQGIEVGATKDRHAAIELGVTKLKGAK